MRRLMMIFQSSHRQLAQQRLFEAQRAQVDHLCQAQYHNAMAAMAAEQIKTLQQIVDGNSVDARIPLPELSQ